MDTVSEMYGGSSDDSLAIVILSYAQDESLKCMTNNAINTLNESCLPENTQIVVVESNRKTPPYQQENVKTVYLDPPFNFNKYMNYGISITQSKYVALCNNDLVFSKNWMVEIQKAFDENPDVYSISPACPDHHPKQGFPLDSGIYLGHRVWKEVAGWCLVFKREMLEITGYLDERFYFWFADDDYARTLEKYQVKHALLTSSHVRHLDKRTLKKQDDFKKFHLTFKSRAVYEQKWKGRTSLSVFLGGIYMYVDFFIYKYIRRKDVLEEDDDG
ncbi:glycosyltransferase family 2 protein [Pseudomonas sp. LRF_L74]|uniref:glycosyltransferase family 2 protein n=1 Tax=Pseudomonas sp. LRF_L74 TaxID=3369422 RepID=UPI003F60F290